MSISDKIQALETSRQAIATAISQKGGTVAQGDGFSQFATEISNLPSGGDDSTLRDLIERDITSINIPSGTTRIGGSAFSGCTSLTSVIIPSSVTQILSSAFYQCTGLVSITIPNSVNYMQDNVFYNCTSLTSVVLPSGITLFQQGLFYNCTSLTSVTIPNSVTRIFDSALRNCSSLTSISIPSSVTEIGSRAFQGCSSLTSFTCNATTPPTAGANALTDTNNCPIYVPAASVDTYKTVSGWSTYADRIQAIPT